MAARFGPASLSRLVAAAVDTGPVREEEPLPHGVEHLEGIAQRLHHLLSELQDANRANYPPGAWTPGELQCRLMEAIDSLMDGELQLMTALQAIKEEQQRRLGRRI